MLAGPRSSACVLLACFAAGIPTPGQASPTWHCPQKFVLVTEGRSGSTPMANAIEYLTHSQGTTLHTELLGSEHTHMAKDPVSIMTKWFQTSCWYHPHAGLIGFKFKPYIDINSSGQPKESKWGATMKWLKGHNAKLLKTHRNHLDKMISGEVDKVMDKLGFAAHCEPDEHKCIQAHQDAKVTMLTGDALLRRLKTDTDKDDAVVAMLKRYGLNFHVSSFESLFDAPENEQLKEWQAVLKFLRPSAPTLTKSELAKAQGGTIRVGSSHQKDRVKNYEDVKETLKGTKFEKLLH